MFDWDQATRFLLRRDEPVGADLYLDATDPLHDNLARLDDMREATWPRRSIAGPSPPMSFVVAAGIYLQPFHLAP